MVKAGLIAGCVVGGVVGGCVLISIILIYVYRRRRSKRVSARYHPVVVPVQQFSHDSADAEYNLVDQAVYISRGPKPVVPLPPPPFEPAKDTP